MLIVLHFKSYVYIIWQTLKIGFFLSLGGNLKVTYFFTCLETKALS